MIGQRDGFKIRLLCIFILIIFNKSRVIIIRD